MEHPSSGARVAVLLVRRWTFLCLLLALLPTPAHAQGPSADELRPLRDRLVSLQERAGNGEIGLLPGPSGEGAPPWLVVSVEDARSQLAALALAGEISEAEAARKATELRRQFATGLARLERVLAEVESRLRAAGPAVEVAPPGRPAARETPPATPRDAIPSRGRDTNVTPSGASETWEIRLTGVGGPGGDKALSSLSGRVDLEVGTDGVVHGRIAYEGHSVADPSVTGRLQDRRVLLRFDAPEGAGEALLTGTLDATGKHANGRYQISSGAAVVTRGSWRATRP